MRIDREEMSSIWVDFPLIRRVDVAQDPVGELVLYSFVSYSSCVLKVKTAAVPMWMRRSPQPWFKGSVVDV